MLEDLLKRNRKRLNEEIRGHERRRFFSPAIYSADQLITSAILTHARGRIIDIGCGDMPYKDIIQRKATRYDTLDVERRAPGVKYISDIHDMSVIHDGSYDTVVCFSVLEHVQNPFQAVSEICRILKKGGTLILSVPHLSRLHEEPNDFFRYTKYGLHALLESVGFEVLEIVPTGGLFSFLGHQFSTVFVCSLWHIPVIKRIVFSINKWLCVKPCYWLDRAFDRRKFFALGYLCVAVKKANH